MPGRRTWLPVALFLSILTPSLHGQQPPAAAPPDRLAAIVSTAAGTAQRTAPPADLDYANRRVVTLRATVVSRPPEARARAARDVLRRLVDETPTARAHVRTYPDAAAVYLGEQPVFVLFEPDIEQLENEDLAGAAQAAAARLDVAFAEAVELHTPTQLVTAGGIALAVTALYVLMLWLVVRMDR